MPRRLTLWVDLPVRKSKVMEIWREEVRSAVRREYAGPLLLARIKGARLELYY